MRGGPVGWADSSESRSQIAVAFEIHEHAFSDCMQIGAEVAWLAACHSTESFRIVRMRSALTPKHTQSGDRTRHSSRFPFRKLTGYLKKLCDVGREAEATAAAADN